jgi:hypothetical protein
MARQGSRRISARFYGAEFKTSVLRPMCSEKLSYRRVSALFNIRNRDGAEAGYWPPPNPEVGMPHGSVETVRYRPSREPAVYILHPELANLWLTMMSPMTENAEPKLRSRHVKSTCRAGSLSDNA